MSEAQLKLTRQLKGLLNRCVFIIFPHDSMLILRLSMSEQNIASIVDGVEEVYRNNRRHGVLGTLAIDRSVLTRTYLDVTETLTKLITEGISSHSMLLDQYVVLHAAFVSALHKLIGIEFGTRYLQFSV